MMKNKITHKIVKIIEKMNKICDQFIPDTSINELIFGKY